MSALADVIRLAYARNPELAVNCEAIDELVALRSRAEKAEAALREIDELLTGSLPVTHQVKEIIRTVLEEK